MTPTAFRLSDCLYAYVAPLVRVVTLNSPSLTVLESAVTVIEPPTLELAFADTFILPEKRNVLSDHRWLVGLKLIHNLLPERVSDRARLAVT